MEMPIKSVSLFFPMSTEGENVHYVLGSSGVTAIVPMWKNGKFCYVIYKEENLFAELYHYSHVQYEERNL